MSLFSYCFTKKHAVDSKFVSHVKTIIHSRKNLFQANPCGLSREFFKIEDVTPVGDKVLFEAKQQLAEFYGLGDYVTPPKLKDFIGYMTAGGFVHAHTDRDLPRKMHVRVNVLISVASGCVPIEGIPIAVEVSDAWLNLASRCSHATTPVKGAGFRSALSFGYQIDPMRGDELYKVHKAWLSGLSEGAFRQPNETAATYRAIDIR